LVDCCKLIDCGDYVQGVMWKWSLLSFLKNYDISCNEIYLYCGNILQKVEVIFPQSLCHYQHTFFFHLCVGRCMPVAEASELFTHAVFRLLVIHKSASLEFVLQGAKSMEVGGCWIGTVGSMRENISPYCCSCIPCAWTGVWSGVRSGVRHAGGGLVSSSCLAKPFSFIFLTMYLISAHIGLNWLWSFFPRIVPH
jgi:hypothetical protein